jgi:hypothetical protein
MTYQQKYQELYAAYEKAAQALNEAREKIEDINGFGDGAALSDYLNAHRKYRYAESEFHKLLNYVTTANLNPESEYIAQEYMYEFIKADQRRKGIPWIEAELRPSKESGASGYECNIGLSNNGEIDRMIQGTEYVFPVLNLHHGKECYTYLSKMLQDGGGEDFDVNKLTFDRINENQQVYVKVRITVWS